MSTSIIYALQGKQCTLYERKMDAEYAHVRFRRRDKVRFKEVPLRTAQRWLKQGTARMGK